MAEASAIQRSKSPNDIIDQFDRIRFKYNETGNLTPARLRVAMRARNRYLQNMYSRQREALQRETDLFARESDIYRRQGATTEYYDTRRRRFASQNERMGQQFLRGTYARRNNRR